MKKKALYLILSIFFFSIVSLIILLTLGFETNRFNKLISKQVQEANNINIQLNAVKFKLDSKNLNLFLETSKPKIVYKKNFIPIQKLRVYINFLPLLKSEVQIDKVNVTLERLTYDQLNKLSTVIKPSNFKSLLNNKIKSAELISEIDFFFNKNGTFEDFIAKGSVENLETEIINGLSISETNLSFFADKNDILIKNINGKLKELKIFEGDIKINLEDGVKLSSNFNTKFKLNKKDFPLKSKFLRKLNLPFEINYLSANLNNNFSISFDNTYKVTNYDYKSSGIIEKGNLRLLKSLKSKILISEVSNIHLSNLNISTSSKNGKVEIIGNGNYSFDNLNFNQISFRNSMLGNSNKLKLNFDYNKDLEIDLINYKKIKNSVATFLIDFEKKNNILNFRQFNYKEGSNKIILNELKFENNKFLSFEKILAKTENNDFSITNNEKIIIKGAKFDASNLFKFLSNQNNQNQLKKLNREIEIDFKNIKVPMSEKLQNFKLIGEIKKGKFVKISSKGDFGANNYLDISMKKNKNNDTKYLEVYSDLTRPLLTEYSFFDGLSGGKLLYTSVIESSRASSKLKIEDFKVVNAPGVIKLLSLADLAGLADLAEGEGLSFDILEIKMEKNKDFLKLNEILALGPSLSVLMEGYQDESGITSLKGTLVPAKTLNKLISKIPIFGNIVVPKEVGEGLFGISFKMKGPKDKIKTTINPIRTLTPRFIQKIIDKKNN
jgi:hypothetical protein